MKGDTVTEPRTAAGRALLDEWWPVPDRHDPESIERMDAAHGILAIEDEARAAGLREAEPPQIDVERLALAVARAVVAADQLYPAGYSMTGDLVPLIAAEYARLRALTTEGIRMQQRALHPASATEQPPAAAGPAVSDQSAEPQP